MIRSVCPRLVHLFSTVAFLVGLESAAVASETRAQYRRWTRSDGKQSALYQPVRFDPKTGIVIFQSPAGKIGKCSIDSLVRADRERLKQNLATGGSQMHASMLTVQRQPALPAMRHGEPRKSADMPVEIVKTREEVYQVQVPYTEQRTVCVPRVHTYRYTERFGLFGCRQRVVCRTRTVMVPETRSVTMSRSESRTRTVAFSQSSPSLLNLPGAAQEGPRLISLKVPQSAGAIAKQISAVLDRKYPPSQFDFVRTENDSVVDYQQNVPVNGLRVMVRVEIQTDPTIIQLLTAALDVNNSANSLTAEIFPRIAVNSLSNFGS